MKNLTFLFGFIILMASCDKVDDPYPEGGPTNDPGDGSEPFIGTLVIDTVIDPSLASGPVAKNILLEDYTGFKCTNCPEAHEVADDLRDTYGEQLVVMSLHVSESFAEPDPGTPFDVDLRTQDGEIYFPQFGISALPSGLINRSAVDGFLPIAYENWGANVEALINDLSPVKLDIADVSFLNDTLSMNFSIEILEDLEGTYAFSINLVEKEVITAQDNAGTIILDYVQKEVFRGTLNGTFGTVFSTDPIDLDLHNVEGHYYLPGSFDNPDVPNPDIEIEDCEVIIYVYKQDLDNGVFDIIQVVKEDVSL